ncbi:hypothetical protein [Yersinia mollaretii]|uniref:hypothetical protein n=1 Tax=Yersinia mollaretii TaxID=33060 RepID=UPI0011A8B984|nr:hypothetical protein [Yersinia mollaretii]
MNEYNYQRMLEESWEQYERVLRTDPDEQAVLMQRTVCLLRQLHQPCAVTFSGSHHREFTATLPAFPTELMAMQADIVLRAAKRERAREQEALYSDRCP